MPPRKTDKVQIACPHCGHRQAESRAVISTNCRKCGQYFNLDRQPEPPARPRAPAKPIAKQRRVTCFDCGTELAVAASAESTMCKRCSSYVDLKDYRIESSISKNFKTKGTFVIEPKGYVFNTESIVEHAIIKGRFLGKLDALGTLTIHSGAQIKGTFTAAKLIIPESNHFRWPEPLRLQTMDVAGELVADVFLRERGCLRSTGRLFGNAEAKHLVVEAGAVVVGLLKIGGW